MDEYQNLFAGVKSEKAIGEISPGYLWRGEAENIKRYLPDVKLIAVLRNPVETVYSSYMMRVRDGLESCVDFQEAIKNDEQKKLENPVVGGYLEKAFYYSLLVKFYNLFPRERIRVYLFDDLKNSPNEMLKDLFQFLEVDEYFKVDLSQKHNSSGVIKNPVLRHLWTKSNSLRDFVRPLLSEKIRHTAFEWVVRDMTKLPLKKEMRRELIEVYRDDINKLQGLIQRDLSGWLT
jgi:hypothetical protein